MFQLLQFLLPDLQTRYLLGTTLPPSDVAGWHDSGFDDMANALRWILCNVIMVLFKCQVAT